MLRIMRHSSIWLLIAVLWLAITVITALRQGWQRAWLQAVVSLIFFGVGFYFRRKEHLR
jgi:predicted Na+-dependent transporter